MGVCGDDALNCLNTDGGYTCECATLFIFDSTLYGSGCKGSLIYTDLTSNSTYT